MRDAKRHAMRLLWLALASCLHARSVAAEPSDQARDDNRTEVGALPALAYDSDLGFGFGAVGTLARFEEGYAPYRWRLEAQAFTSIDSDAAGEVVVPFHDHYLSLDMPGLAGGVLRLEATASFGRLTHNGYYGLGGDSDVREDRGGRYHYYDRVFPAGDVNARVMVAERLELFGGVHGSYSWMNPYAQSRLLEDRDALHGTGDHGQVAFNTGVLYDTRDHEYAPTRGTFSELSTRLSPGIDADLRYGSVFASSRWFLPLHPEYLIFGGRIAADVMFGRVPVYELRNFGVLDREAGPGGGGSVRGLLLHRYHDTLKLIANAELRANAPWFDLVGERMRFGGVAFADAGRVRGETALGFGGGLRFQWGETFILRGDVGYAPSDDTLGIYVDVGQVF